jgi:hypothetical protein
MSTGDSIELFLRMFSGKRTSSSSYSDRTRFIPLCILKPVGHLWSARVNKTVRALAYREGRIFYWFWIGPHEDYERLLGR